MGRQRVYLIARLVRTVFQFEKRHIIQWKQCETKVLSHQHLALQSRWKTHKMQCWIIIESNCTVSKTAHYQASACDVNVQLHFYLNHCQHALIGDGVGADGEVPGGVSADNAVDGIPVGAVGLVPVHHRQVGHHYIDLVLWHLPRKLQNARGGGRKQMRMERGGVIVKRMGEITLCWCCTSTRLMHVNRLIYWDLKHLLVPSSIF